MAQRTTAAGRGPAGARRPRRRRPGPTAGLARRRPLRRRWRPRAPLTTLTPEGTSGTGPRRLERGGRRRGRERLRGGRHRTDLPAGVSSSGPTCRCCRAGCGHRGLGTATAAAGSAIAEPGRVDVHAVDGLRGRHHPDHPAGGRRPAACCWPPCCAAAHPVTGGPPRDAAERPVPVAAARSARRTAQHRDHQLRHHAGHPVPANSLRRTPAGGRQPAALQPGGDRRVRPGCPGAAPRESPRRLPGT